MISHIVLIVAVLMAGQTPDIRKQVPMNTLDECWTSAKAFVDAPLPTTIDGAVGLSATCGVFFESGNP